MITTMLNIIIGSWINAQKSHVYAVNFGQIVEA